MIQVLAAGLSAVLVTAGCASLARTGGALAWRRAAGAALVSAHAVVLWFFRPPDPLVRAGVVIFLGAITVVCNTTALELRLRGKAGGSYLWDVLTQSSDHLVPNLRIAAVSPLFFFARGALFAAMVATTVVILRGVPPNAMPLALWIYLKMLVLATGTQALSDLVVAASRGRAVPMMNLPQLSTSYFDFWGRRYNIWTHGILRWAARDLMGLARHRRLQVIAAFALSGVLHEGISLLLLGRVTGYWSAFWAAQLLLAFVFPRRKLPPFVAMVLFQLTFLATAPLFFAVIDRVVNFFGPLTPAPW